MPYEVSKKMDVEKIVYERVPPPFDEHLAKSKKLDDKLKTTFFSSSNESMTQR